MTHHTSKASCAQLEVIAQKGDRLEDDLELLPLAVRDQG